MESELQLGSGRDGEDRRRMGFVVGSRAVLVTILLGATTFFNLKNGRSWDSPSQLVLYGVSLAVFLFSAGCVVWLRLGRGKLGAQAQVQVAFDVLMTTLLLYVTGSVESPYTFLYAFPIIVSAIFQTRRSTYLTAGLCGLFLGALFVLENQKLLPVDLDGLTQASPTTEKVVYLLAFNYAVLLAVAALSGILAEQLRKAGRQLETTRDSLDQLLALNCDIVLSLRSGLMALNQAGNVTLLNPVAEQIVGCRGNEVLGRPGVEVFTPLAELLGASGQSESNGGWQRLEVCYHRPADRREVPVGLTLSPLSHPGGTGAGTLIHMQDLTQRKEMEARVKRAERLAVLGGMAAGIAHEIRNPLAAISGSVQMLKDSPGLGEQERRLMAIVLRESERLNALISDFLTFARPKELRRSRTDLRELVSETIELLLRRAEDGQPEVSAELEPVSAEVDPDQFQQVLWNLLANAVDAGGKGGKLVVRLGAETNAAGQKWLVLEVSDNGPGVPEELRDKVFEPFFTTKEKGSGLGLAIVQRIVEAHGGVVELGSPCENGAGAGSGNERGSRFTVKLPGVCG